MLESKEKRQSVTVPTLFTRQYFSAQKSPKDKLVKPEPVKESRRIPILTSEKLLVKKRHQESIRQCVQFLEFSEEQKALYVTPLIHAFTEFVQNLPETRNSYFSKLGGFIDHALMRTTNALTMCRAYFSANAGNKNASLTPVEMLWMYTLFSAGIFNGIGKVFSDFIIELYDEKGKHLDRWSPFEGNMSKTHASFYDYDFESAKRIDLFSRRISVLLAKQLMPFEGFAWIASDKEVLSVWLALLEDNQRDAGALGPFFVRADAMAINDYFDERRLQRQYGDLDVEAREKVDDVAEEKEAAQEEKDKLMEDELKLQASIAREERKAAGENDGESIEASAVAPEVGIEFLKWLTNELKAQRLIFNESIFYLPTGAIFLPTALFEGFKKKHPNYRSLLDIIASFNQLELQSKSSGQNNMHTFVHATENGMKKVEGFVLQNAQLILPKHAVTLRLMDGSLRILKASELSQQSHLLTPLQPVGSAAGKSEIMQTHKQEPSSPTYSSLFGR